MNGVRDQRQRACGITEHQFGHDKHRVERDAHREGKAEMIRRVAVPGMTVRMVMTMGMIMAVTSVAVILMVVMMGHATNKFGLVSACDYSAGI